MEKCNHKWMDVKDGTDDQICIMCFLKQKQAVMKIPEPVAETIQMPILEPIAIPIAREKIEIVVADGKRVSVYKDDFDKAFLKAAGLYISLFEGGSR